MPADQRKKTEMSSSIMMMLAFWAMCGGGTVTCDAPEPDVPKDNPKALVDEMKDKVKDKGGVKRPTRCNGGFPRDDNDPQTSTPVVQRRVAKKKCFKLNRFNVEQQMGGSKCRKESSFSSSSSCAVVEFVPESPVITTIPSSSSSSSSSDGRGYAGQTGLTSTSSESEEDGNTGGGNADLDEDQDVGSSSDDREEK